MRSDKDIDDAFRQAIIKIKKIRRISITGAMIITTVFISLLAYVNLALTDDTIFHINDNLIVRYTGMILITDAISLTIWFLFNQRRVNNILKELRKL